MSEIDQQFIEYVVKSIVSNPDAVSIQRTVDERGVLLELSVDPEDLGRVIGKRGATAQSLRTLLRALGTKNEARYNLKIVDTDGGSGRSNPPAQARDDVPANDSAASAAAPADEGSNEAEEEQATTEEIVEAAEPEVVEQAPAPEVEDDDQTDLASKTRRELAELDDLDV